MEETQLRVEETTDRLFAPARDGRQGSGVGMYVGDDPAPRARTSQGRDSLGDAWTSSESYALWLSRFPDGGPSRGDALSDSVVVRAPVERVLARALISAQDASAGHLVRPDRAGLIPGAVRPLTVRDLITVLPTSSDLIEVPREQSRVEGAAPVAEASAVTGTTGTKPEGGLVFELIQVATKTIAEWVASTKRVIQDAPMLRAYIDSYLAVDLAIELEDQIVSGSGTGENFAGILNTSGIQTLAAPTSPASALDNLRKAKRMIRVAARTNPTAVLLNPQDTERIDLLKINNEANHFVGGGLIPGGGGPFGTSPGTVWGMPVVESEAVPVNTGLVGDFRRAILFDREATNISVGTAGDDFIRNLVRILAELRAGFVVVRPAAFVSVTLS